MSYKKWQEEVAKHLKANRKKQPRSQMNLSEESKQFRALRAEVKSLAKNGYSRAARRWSIAPETIGQRTNLQSRPEPAAYALLRDLMVRVVLEDDVLVRELFHEKVAALYPGSLRRAYTQQDHVYADIFFECRVVTVPMMPVPGEYRDRPSFVYTPKDTSN